MKPLVSHLRHQANPWILTTYYLQQQNTSKRQYVNNLPVLLRRFIKPNINKHAAHMYGIYYNFTAQLITEFFALWGRISISNSQFEPWKMQTHIVDYFSIDQIAKWKAEPSGRF